MSRVQSDMVPVLGGKVCLVTGATSGIGLATARALAARGASVIGIGRDAERAERARASVALHAADPAARIRYDLLDLSDLSAVSAYARDFKGFSGASTRLDVLVNCAGFYSDRRILSKDGFEMQFAVNHLAPFCLTTGLLDALALAPDARIVTVSSDSHRFGAIRWRELALMKEGNMPRLPYLGILAYGQSKLANVLFSSELAARLAVRGMSGITVFTADPGLVNTEMGLKQGFSLGSLVWNIRRRGGTDAEVPAEAIAWLVSEPSLAGRTGLYWKDRQAIEASARAGDSRAARRLWEESEALIRRASARRG